MILLFDLHYTPIELVRKRAKNYFASSSKRGKIWNDRI